MTSALSHGKEALWIFCNQNAWPLGHTLGFYRSDRYQRFLLHVGTFSHLSFSIPCTQEFFRLLEHFGRVRN